MLLCIGIGAPLEAIEPFVGALTLVAQTANVCSSAYRILAC